jgi:hypothetical protein
MCHLGPVLFTLKEWIMYIILATMSTHHRPRHIPHNPESSSSGVLGIVGTLVNNEIMGAQGGGRRKKLGTVDALMSLVAEVSTGSQ